MPTSIAPIFFRRTHLPFTRLLRSNAHWFSGRLLTYRPCISNLFHQEKILFHIFIHMLYLYISFFFCFSFSPLSLYRSIYISIYLSFFSTEFFLNRVTYMSTRSNIFSILYHSRFYIVRCANSILKNALKLELIKIQNYIHHPIRILLCFRKKL